MEAVSLEFLLLDWDRVTKNEVSIQKRFSFIDANIIYIRDKLPFVLIDIEKCIVLSRVYLTKAFT